MISIAYKQNGATVIGDLTYEYDKAGNRTKTGGSWARTGMPEPITTTNYDANNRQLTFGDKTLSYDDNGNLQSITDSNGTTLYSWNARNQLVAIDGPSVNASFVYDGIGRREKKTVNGNLMEFLYDGVNPVQETSGAAILANVLPGLRVDEFLTRTDVVAGATSNFLTDALGSPVVVTDNAAAVQTEYSYELFGRTTAIGASNSSSYQYTGRENDGTSLYYYRARYYNAQLQRFIAEDPIGFRAGDVNLYSYVGNNPLNFVDPSGLAKDECCECPSKIWSGAGISIVGVIGNAGGAVAVYKVSCWDKNITCRLTVTCVGGGGSTKMWGFGGGFAGESIWVFRGCKRSDLEGSYGQGAAVIAFGGSGLMGAGGSISGGSTTSVTAGAGFGGGGGLLVGSCRTSILDCF